MGLVPALNSGGCEEEVGVICSIGPLYVVDLGVSSVPLVSQCQDQLDSIDPCSVNNVIQSLEDSLIVDSCRSQLLVRTSKTQSKKQTQTTSKVCKRTELGCKQALYRDVYRYLRINLTEMQNVLPCSGCSTTVELMPCANTRAVV